MSIGYKIFATILHKRLLDGGADRRISSTQFGFRSGRSAQDAIFIARRRIELGISSRDGQLSLLALDWQKCFDSIDPGAMIQALRRFGVPEKFLRVVQAIYADRRFQVKDGADLSKVCRQKAGISQGCPLSPYLFIMVMTVVMADAASSLPGEDQTLINTGSMAELLYADDTLLMSVGAPSLQRFLAAVCDAGAACGLQLHWGKLQLVKIKVDDDIRRPDGTIIEASDEMAYLGTVLRADGRFSPELARRLGMAGADFRSLMQLWKHTSIPRQKKLQIYKAIIETRLTYSMASAWLNASDRRRLDGFQNRCLRTLWGIKPAFVSRVGNATVLSEVGAKPLSSILLAQQLIMFGRAARAPPGDLLFQATFADRFLRPAPDQFIRRQGRPQLEWTSEVRKHALRIAGSIDRMCELVGDSDAWRHAVHNYLI